jgi:hypothetical protein
MLSSRSPTRRFRAASVLTLAFLAVAGVLWYRSSLPDLHTGYASEVRESVSWVPSILSDSSRTYLPDFSYAGYRWSEHPLPVPDVTLHAADFGVVPDDGMDDTAALRRALNAPQQDSGWVVLSLPAGTIEISGVLFLERDHFVLRGQTNPDGTPSTILAVTGSLSSWGDPKADSLVADIAAYQRENNLNNLLRPFSPYTWAGGMIWSRLPGKADPIAAIVPATQTGSPYWTAISGTQGSHRVVVSSSDNRRPPVGGRLELRWVNRTGDKGALLDHVLGKQDLPVGKRLTEDPGRPLVLQPVTVDSIAEHLHGWEVFTREPLVHGMLPDWQVELHPLKRLEHVGIEHLSIQFESDDPPPHHLDKGYNGIYLTDTRDSWILNVRIEDADTPVLTNRTNQISISGLHTAGREGHHSVYPSNSYGVLITDFRLEAPALHHPTFPTGSVLSVYTGGQVQDAVLDQHGGLNQQNLYDNLTLDTDDVWLDGGGAGYWNPTSGRFNTFWNVHVRSGQVFAGTIRDAPDARVVGMRNDAEEISLRYGPDTYVEGLQRTGLAVPSLFAWQLERRLTRPGSAHPRQSVQ